MKTTTKLLTGTLVTGLALFIYTAWGKAKHGQSRSKQSLSTKYPLNVMQAVRADLGVPKHSVEMDDQIESMRKIDVMDTYLKSFGTSVKGIEVRMAVLAIFDMDLDNISRNNYGNKLNSYAPAIMETLRKSMQYTDAEIMSLPKVKVMDAYLTAHDFALTGAEHRVLINQIFGVNLDGISGVEGMQLGIHSKGTLIIDTPTDMLVISSSLDDVEIYVATTDYWKRVTGTNEVTDALKQYLVDHGFTYDAEKDRYIWVNPTGESAPETFKSETISTLIQTIKQVNADVQGSEKAIDPVGDFITIPN